MFMLTQVALAPSGQSSKRVCRTSWFLDFGSKQNPKIWKYLRSTLWRWEMDSENLLTKTGQQLKQSRNGKTGRFNCHGFWTYNAIRVAKPLSDALLLMPLRRGNIQFQFGATSMYGIFWDEDGSVGMFVRDLCVLLDTQPTRVESDM